MRRGSNLPAVGTYNQTLVLDLIRRAGEGLSRSELAERTGLSAQTLSNVARKLVADGMVLEGAPIIYGKGKPRTPLRLNPAARYSLGIHLDPAVDTFVLLDMSGSVLAHAERAPQEAGARPDLIAALGRHANELLDIAGIHRDRVLGLGVAAPGPIDAELGALLEPPLLPAWHHTPLRAALEEAAAMPVILEKDVVAAMVGELWLDATQQLSDAIYFYYGAGVGVGLAVDATAVRGRTGNAGDIAHLVVEPGGPLCHCGQHGCLGVVVAPERIIADSFDGFADDLPPPTEMPNLLTAAVSKALAGESAPAEVFARTGRALARAMILMNNLLDADVVVIGGPIWNRIAAAVEPTLRRELETSTQRTTTRQIMLMPSQVNTDVTAIGAACLVLDSAFTARPAGLMISAG